jgi:menaquinol-cytochrome c reductase iron-sulfur subunit
MPKSLNPHAAPSGEAVRSSHSPPEFPETPRRNMLVAVMAGVLGALVAVFPFGAGLLVFLDPILRRKASGSSGDGSGSGRPKLRVATIEALPTDGTPVQVPVIADQTNVWNREPNQPVGAVYLRRQGNKVECLNAICPHAGCFVAYSAERKLFQCPCHTSAFELDGERILPSPSPRDMDQLTVDEEKLKEGEVWVEFVNFYPGKATQEAKP